MKLVLAPDELADYVGRQCDNLFPTGTSVRGQAFRRAIDGALGRLEHSLSRFRGKYEAGPSALVFDPAHTDHYAMFLYFLAKVVHREQGDPRAAGKVYALNKALHALDVFYEVDLPDVFYLQHPVGTVLGRATYADYLMVYQRCSVGSSVDNDYPVIGEGVVMYGGASIIGPATVGNNVWLSVGALVMGVTIPDDSIVFGQAPLLTVKPASRSVRRDLFGEK